MTGGTFYWQDSDGIMWRKDDRGVERLDYVPPDPEGSMPSFLWALVWLVNGVGVLWLWLVTR